MIKIKRVLSIVAVITVLLFTVSAQKANHGFNKVRDIHSEHILRQFVNDMFKVSGVSEKTLKPLIIPSNVFNAFATLDGTMAVFTEVLFTIKDVEALIGILAHETGHIACRHILASNSVSIPRANSTMMMGMAIGLAAAVVTKSGELAATSLMVSNRVAMADHNAHTLGVEASADHKAVDILRKLRWPIRSLTKAMDEIKKFQARVTGNSAQEIPSYLNDHPLTKDRIKFAEEQASKQKGGFTLPSHFRQQYSLLRGRAIGLLKPVREVTSRSGDDVETNYAKALAYTRLQKLDSALEYIDKVLKQTNNDKYVKIAKAEILTNLGEHIKALVILKDVVKTERQNPLVWYELAEIHSKLNDNLNAKNALLKVYYSGDDIRYSQEFWKLLISAYEGVGDKINARLSQIELLVLEKKYYDARDLLQKLKKEPNVSKAAHVKIKDLENQIDEHESKKGIF